MKLVLNEEGTDQSEKLIKGLLKKGGRVFTVDIAMAECLNALWKHALVFEEYGPGDAMAAAMDFLSVYDCLNIVGSRSIAEDAMRISLGARVAFYDGLFLAAAKELKGKLYTADLKLFKLSKGVATSELVTWKRP